MIVLVPCLSRRLTTPAGEDAATLFCQGCGTALPPPGQSAWFMLRDRAQYGPYSIAELAAWVSERRILLTDSIWYQGAPIRLEANQLPHFGPQQPNKVGSDADGSQTSAEVAVQPAIEAEPDEAVTTGAPAPVQDAREPEPDQAPAASAPPVPAPAEGARFGIPPLAAESGPLEAETTPAESGDVTSAPPAGDAPASLIVHIPCLACRIATPVPQEAAAVSCRACGTALPPPAQPAWFMLRDGSQFGPYTTGQLAGYIAERRILPNDSVWYHGATMRLDVNQLPPFGEVEDQPLPQTEAVQSPPSPRSFPSAPAEEAPLPTDGSDWNSVEVQRGETKLDSWLVSLWSMGIETSGSLTVTDRRLLFKPKIGGRSLVGMIISQTRSFKDGSKIVLRRDRIISVHHEKRLINNHVVVTTPDGSIDFNRGVMSADAIVAALQPR